MNLKEATKCLPDGLSILIQNVNKIIKFKKKINGIVYKTLKNAAMFLRSQKLYSTIKVSITLKKA